MARPYTPLTSIVMLCHNDGLYIRKCLEAIRRATAPRRTPYEIILINNASQDGSSTFLRRFARAKDVRLIENRKNRFFAGGNNQGIRLARGAFVLLLNADTLPAPGWLERMIECAGRDPAIGLVGPCTNRAAGYQWVPAPPYRLPSQVDAFSRRWSQEHTGSWQVVHRLTAFCLLIKREVIQQVGLLDERFGPGGYEDYDYCIRVNQAGYKIALAEDVFVHHYGGKGYVGMDYDSLRVTNRAVLARKWSEFALEALDELDAFLCKRGNGNGTLVASGGTMKSVALMPPRPAQVRRTRGA